MRFGAFKRKKRETSIDFEVLDIQNCLKTLVTTVLNMQFKRINLQINLKNGIIIINNVIAKIIF